MNCWVYNEMDLGEVACRDGNYLQPEQSSGSAPPNAVLQRENSALLCVQMAPACST